MQKLGPLIHIFKDKMLQNRTNRVISKDKNYVLKQHNSLLSVKQESLIIMQKKNSRRTLDEIDEKILKPLEECKSTRKLK